MGLTVVIPVFNAADALADCLASLDQYVPGDQEILLIDDGSSDPRIVPMIARFANRPSRRGIMEQQNRGFVATANLGFRITDGDVLLLNSDTIVTPGWIEGLTRCVASDQTIGTATPFSNNAEICSLPKFVTNNPVPADLPSVAEAIRASGKPQYPDIPTAVGFCMLITRRLLHAIGDFDEQTFGHGYGEENDFCMRAIAAGFRNVLCDDVYVAHQGGQSFAGTGHAPGPETMQRLLGKHPEYHQLVSDFIRRDPLSARRHEIVDYCGRQGVGL